MTLRFPEELRTGFEPKLVHRVRSGSVTIVKWQNQPERPATQEQTKGSVFMGCNVIRPRKSTETLTPPDRTDIANITPSERSRSRKAVWRVPLFM